MPHTGVLAQRYAEGLLGVVRDTGRFREVAAELQSFLRVMTDDDRVRDLMENPAYGAADRLSLLEGLRSILGFSDFTYGFLRLVVQKKRTTYIGEMVEAYEARYREELGILRTEVLVALEIGPEMERNLTEVVEKITGKQPELSIRVDPSIIGGVKLQMGNTILDASTKTKLEELHEELLKSPQAAVQ
jgi:F-type H+-transporting ATPase subunit delta